MAWSTDKMLPKAEKDDDHDQDTLKKNGYTKGHGHLIIIFHLCQLRCRQRFGLLVSKGEA